MLEGYNIDYGKVNWNWCHSLSILEEEIEELLISPPAHAGYYPKAAGAYEVVGYTKQRKFLSVTFTLKGDDIVVEDVNLPTYETIQLVILSQLATGNEPFDDR